MDYPDELMDDMCCATCWDGELLLDVDEGYVVRCRRDDTKHSEDFICGKYN